MNTYKVGQDEISFTIWDTSGSQAYDSIRPLSYNEADIFMLCFSVAGTKENINVFIKWHILFTMVYSHYFIYISLNYVFLHFIEKKTNFILGYYCVKTVCQDENQLFFFWGGVCVYN